MTTFIPALTLPSQVFTNPAVSVLLPVTIGAAIGFSVSPKDTQKTYLALKQPPGSPPGKVFGPVWTTLYGLMGYAAYRAWWAGSQSLSPATRDLAKHGATLYTIQLALNFVWMPLFYGFKRPAEASGVVVALTGINAYLAYTWGQVDTVAGWALAPYVAWLGFASYLSIGVGYLNNWNLADKERSMPPSGKGDTNFINEKKK